MLPIPYVRFPLGVVCASVFALIWMYLLEQPDPHTVLYYHVGVITFAASTVITLLAEPVRMVSQIMLYSRLRVRFNINRISINHQVNLKPHISAQCPLSCILLVRSRGVSTICQVSHGYHINSHVSTLGSHCLLRVSGRCVKKT